MNIQLWSIFLFLYFLCFARESWGRGLAFVISDILFLGFFCLNFTEH